MALLSGTLVLGLEVLWTRMLAQVHENSIYAYAIVLAVFLAGLAGGAFLSRLLLSRSFDPNRALGLAWIGSGLLVFASPGLFYFLTNGLSYVNEFGSSPALTTVTLALATMLLPTLLAGMVLPLLMDLITGSNRGEAGPMLGSLLAKNTAGAIAGPLIATFILLPKLGLWVSIAVAGFAMILIGELVLSDLHSRAVLVFRRSTVLSLLAASIIVGNPLNLPAVKFKRQGNETLVHLEEGSHGIVAVVENPDERWMLLNNFYTLGGTGSAIEERQQARIPLFLHPSPHRVAFLGLGTGITAGGALLPPVENLVAIEIVPEVVRIAKEFFAEANLGVLTDPRVTAINEDARVYLRTSGQTFDVIVGDLVVPARSGESALFTREHFVTARQALAPDGIFCQWLPMHQLSR
jgi:spermidine synthase